MRAGGNTHTRRVHSPVQLVALIKGSLVGIGIALVLSLVIGLIVGMIDLDPIPPYVYLFHYVSILIGGATAGRSVERFGWLHGGLVGLIYLGVMGYLFPPGYHVVAAPEATFVTGALWSFLAGVAGGMLGLKRT